MPVRKVVRPTGRGVRGYFPSRKMGRMIAWESLLERDAILRFEFSSAIIRYEEQPQHVYYEQDGVTREYIPDFELIFDTGEVMHIEVKPSNKLKEPENAKKYAAIAEHYVAIGMPFRILSEKEIRSQPSLTNLQRLARYLPRDTEENLDLYLQNLSLLPGRTIEGASIVCGDALPVYKLLATGHYWFDINQPLTENTEIYPGEKESRNASLFF